MPSLSQPNAPLFRPLTIGNKLTLKNRIVMAPMTRNFSPGGVPGEDVAAYYRRRAENDVGLIVTEGVAIDHPAAVGDAGLRESAVPDMFGNEALAGWRRVVNEVHDAGGIIFPQLWHQGVMRLAGSGCNPEAESMRPSGIWGHPNRLTSSSDEYVKRMLPETRPMTESEIGDVIAGYARSAAFARDVGFDGIAVHGAHGYLPDTFFWAQTNKRTDKYGGDITARARFGAEVVRAIREAVGADLPVMFRFSQWKQQDFDAVVAETPREMEQWLGVLVDAGVDILDASTRRWHVPAFEGSDITVAGWARKLTGMPTMAVGSIGLAQDMYNRPTAGCAIATASLDPVIERMEQDEFDLIGVGRSFVADPAWAVKARTGEPFEPYTREALERLY